MEDKSKKVSSTFNDWVEMAEVSSERFELIDGVIYFMSRASIRHGILATAISHILLDQLKGGPCKVINETLSVRVKTDFSDDVFRPDVTVVCSNVDLNSMVVENPTIVVEVLSKSTALKDRTLKLESYLNVDDLKGYLMVHQDIREIEWYRKIKGKTVRSVFGSGDTIALDNLISLSIDEVYSYLGENNEIR